VAELADRKTAYLTSLKPDAKTCFVNPTIYNQLQQGQTSKNNLTKRQIERLEEIGFKWKGTDIETTFEQRCHDLEAFKSEFGH